jgi:hypothetical protein
MQGVDRMSRNPSDYIAQRRLTNELGNPVSLVVTKHSIEPAITIHGDGPTSELQHTWTTKEAEALRDMLTDLLGAAA